MQIVVVTPIVEIGLESATTFETMIIADGYVAKIEEAVDIGAQQQPILDLVRAALGTWVNMRGVQDRQRAFARHGASPFVGVCDSQTEASLTQSWRH